MKIHRSLMNSKELHMYNAESFNWEMIKHERCTCKSKEDACILDCTNFHINFPISRNDYCKYLCLCYKKSCKSNVQIK